ncbi:MAG: imidazole glycerol phosphate synthase subunit HisH [Patescibacteria group bacterium]
MIGIINYGVGNLQSVKNSLDYLGIPNTIISKPKEVNKCDKIILPGVGAFGPAMDKLTELGFSKKIKEFAGLKKPILGICLGMQLLFQTSEEGGIHQGLGLVKGKVLAFNKKVRDLPIPHVGWNNVYKDKTSLLFKNIDDNSCFYFVHSFYCEPADKSTVIASTNYSIRFAAAIGKDKIFGCQFHPEKSQTAGLKLLENFDKLT